MIANGKIRERRDLPLLHAEVLDDPLSIELRMIELEVTVAGNPFGLAVGTDIRVAVASASVHNV